MRPEGNAERCVDPRPCAGPLRLRPTTLAGGERSSCSRFMGRSPRAGGCPRLSNERPPTVGRLAVVRPATAVILLLLSAFLGTADAQRPLAASRIGYLSPLSSSDPARQSRFDAFRLGLRELGYVEGQN